MKLALIFALIAAAIIGVDRLALWAESRGWIYWRRSKHRGTGGANVLLDLNAFGDPGAKHVIEARQAEPTGERTDDDIVPPPPLASRRPPG